MRHIVLLLVAVSILAGCSAPPAFYKSGELMAHEVARSDRQWTGVAVSSGGTVFVSYPRWSDEAGFSVGRFDRDGVVHAFPDLNWNTWTPGADPANHFVCVQSVVVDRLGRLWVLDPASPKFAGVVPGGAKLVCFDTATGQMLHNYRFAAPIVRPDSYLNDVRIDPDSGYAYITDSGVGGLVVLELATGTARRVLDSSPATHAEDIPVVINGEPWLRDGKTPRINADGIALSRDGQMLYFHALTGKTLSCIRTQWLQDDRVSENQLAGLVQRVGVDRPCDGMEIDLAGNVYLTDIERSAITRVVPNGDGTVRYEKLVTDSRLEWPDSLAWDISGNLYVTTSRINLTDKSGPYRLLKIVPLR